MLMKVSVNDQCIGCYMCASIADEVFEMEDSKTVRSVVKKNADFGKNKEKIKEAKLSCPVGAIEIEE